MGQSSAHTLTRTQRGPESAGVRGDPRMGPYTWGRWEGGWRLCFSNWKIPKLSRDIPLCNRSFLFVGGKLGFLFAILICVCLF